MLNLVLPNVHEVKARLTYEVVKTINGDEVLPVARIVLNVPGLEPDAVRELMHYVLAGHGVEVILRSPQEALPLPLEVGVLNEIIRGLPENRSSDADPETGEVTRATAGVGHEDSLKQDSVDTTRPSMRYTWQDAR